MSTSTTPPAAGSAAATSVVIPRSSNQALGIGNFAVDFMAGRIGAPDRAVLDRTALFHTDAVLCGLSAIALGTNAPTLLRAEALEHRREPGAGATLFGSDAPVAPEKAIVANSAAVREWDSNGTNFGFNPGLGHVAGEFGHNDFYPVPVAAAQLAGRDGAYALRGMVLLDEIRGRLAEVFSLKSYKIDHVVHGAIASAATYGAMLGATPEQIESAIGMFVAHHIPWRAIRAGKQLSDSKGASAAISTEAAVVGMQRSMRGFLGPRDIFRNPESMFRQFEKTSGDSPFDLVLSHSGDDFAVMGMHFKLGLYEHQSAGALQGLLTLLSKHPEILASPESIRRITIVAYEPAFGIIGDPAKRDPRTRQSADHSMVYIVATLLRKAIEAAGAGALPAPGDDDGWWKSLMLVPGDYDDAAIFEPRTRGLMEKISFTHGGPEYDRRYPDGIPTSLVIELADGRSFDSGLVMYPAGHARNTVADLRDILATKFRKLGALAVADVEGLVARVDGIADRSASEMRSLWAFPIKGG
ncbi:MAG TPA: MmgE/PrpD family protein [Phycisphaerales bacterium]|nr:MmgE/PrpD family protein [Phycisphaerales bacterium]HMP38472.1 MmgE/PrpD family protein [Phycisphaerales bacterium]